MQRLTVAHTRIRRLAIENRPGAIVLAEHAVDQHAELFSDPDDKLIALDALARDLIRTARLHPKIIGFLRLVDDYIQIVQNDIATARMPAELGLARAGQIASIDTLDLSP